MICRDANGAVKNSCPDPKIKITEVAAEQRTSRFSVIGLAVGPAGYYFNLKRDLANELLPAELSTRLGRPAEVQVGSTMLNPPNGPGQACVAPDGSGGIRQADGSCLPAQ